MSFIGFPILLQANERDETLVAEASVVVYLSKVGDDSRFGVEEGKRCPLR
jgi:hypothetical protein